MGFAQQGGERQEVVLLLVFADEATGTTENLSVQL